MVVSPAVVPPHSGPQLTTYAVEPSGEKIALMGWSKLAEGPVLTGKTHQVGSFWGSQSCAPMKLGLLMAAACWVALSCTMLYTAKLLGVATLTVWLGAWLASSINTSATVPPALTETP